MLLIESFLKGGPNPQFHPTFMEFMDDSNEMGTVMPPLISRAITLLSPMLMHCGVESFWALCPFYFGLSLKMNNFMHE